jgi:class 3 adenylate cyclase
LAAERVERRLTAILAADVAGYSRLMGADKEGTLAQFKAHRRVVWLRARTWRPPPLVCLALDLHMGGNIVHRKNISAASRGS